MQITIAAVGRDRTGSYRSLFETYRSRCPWTIELVEIPLATDSDVAARRHRETLRFAKAIAGCERVISLESPGELLDSETFAALLGRWRDESLRVGVVIGGPDGLDPEALPRIELALAFGRMTWPHQLVRVMLAEQLYRASTILSGHPYHRS